MQRRLFFIFLLLALTPALLLLALNWRMSQRQLAYLESPGIGQALESSLALAREVLQQERTRAGESAAALGAALATPRTPLPDLPEGACWRIAIGGRSLSSPAAGAIDPFADLSAAVSAGREPERIDHAGRQWLLVERPLDYGGRPARLRLLLPLAPELAARLSAIAAGSARYRQLRLYYSTLLRGDTLLTLLFIAAVVVVVSLWLARRLARRIAEPVAALAHSAEIVAGGDLDHQLQVQADDEVGELIRAFNAMTRELKRSRDELLRAERIAAWREIARRLAHEIKNPLTPINLALHRIGRKISDPGIQECVEAAREETHNLQRLADEFSRFARLPAPRPRPLDLVALLRGVIALYPWTDELRVEWRNWPRELPLSGDPGQLRQLFGNLIKNAIEALAGSGCITLTLVAAERRCVVVEIADDGPGFSGDPEALFEPYATRKEGGTGLGLAIARRIAEDHGGKLTARPGSAGAGAAGDGAVFRIELPVASDEQGVSGGPDPGGGR